MATEYPDIFGALAERFHPDEERTRVQAGRTLTYITARIAQNRFDEVLGPENWRVQYTPGSDDTMKCRIELRLPPSRDGEWIAREDGGAAAKMSEEDNNEKSAYSDAFKRCAVAWGVGRYLYQDGSPRFSDRYPGEAATPKGQTSSGNYGGQQRQSSPQRQEERREQPRNDRSSGPSNGQGGAPRSGRALFAWAKENGTKYDCDLVGFINSVGKKQSFPGRLVDWDTRQVSSAFNEAQRFIADGERGLLATPNAPTQPSDDDEDIPF